MFITHLRTRRKKQIRIKKALAIDSFRKLFRD